MVYIVDFGNDTNPERFDSMEEINEWLDDYIINHLQYGEDFETEKQRFVESNISEV